MSAITQLTDYLISLTWLAGIVFAPFALVEGLVSDSTKKRLTETLRSNPHALDNLPQIAANLFERVFGRSHFTLRCIGASVAASLFFFALFFTLRALLMMAVYDFGPTKYVGQEIEYLSFKEVRLSLGVSIALNVVLDYFGLLKTRVIISFLLRRKTSVLRSSSIVFCDLILSFLLFQVFYFAFYLAGFLISFGSSSIFLPAGDAYSFLPMFEAMIIFRFATHPAYPTGTAINFLMHSHAIGIFLVTTLLPLFLVSVFFYASVAPSLWLWLFLLAAGVSRFVAPTWPAVLEVLNFDKAPIKMLGVIASALVVLITTFGLAVFALGLASLSVFLH